MQLKISTNSNKRGRSRETRFFNNLLGEEKLHMHLRKYHAHYQRPKLTHQENTVVEQAPSSPTSIDNLSHDCTTSTGEAEPATINGVTSIEKLQPSTFIHVNSSYGATSKAHSRRTDAAPTPGDNWFQELLQYNGYNYLDTVSQMIFVACTKETKFSASTVAKDLDDSLAEVFIRTAKVAHNMSLSDLDDMARISELTHPKSSKIKLPTTAKAMKEHILSTKGKYSIRSLLPVPKIEALDGGHAYTSLVGLIRHLGLVTRAKDYQSVRERHLALLASEQFQSFKKEVEKFQLGQKQRKTVIVICIFWSDGFDPNETDKNRGSVWALTVTCLFYDCSEFHTIYMVRTGLLSVGVDKMDHTPAFERLLTELKEACNPKEGLPLKAHSFPSHFHSSNKMQAYCSLSKEEVDFFVLPFGCLMDNPERRSNFWLLSHSSKAHKLFGMNCRSDLLKQQFETTDHCDCAKRMREYIKGGDFSKRINLECAECLSFSLVRLLGKEGKYKEAIFERNGEEDDEEIPGEVLFDSPGIIDTDLLVKGWKFAFRKRLTGQWDEKRAMKYLGNVMCINKAGVERFCRHVSEKLEYIRWTKDPDSCSQDVIETIVENLGQNPQYYEQLGSPNPLWMIFKMENVFETIMHNCLNTGKHVAQCSLTWGAGHKLKDQLIKRLLEQLDLVQDLRVDDFKARTFKKEFGGYVAETYRALLVLGPWLFAFLCDDDFQKGSPGKPPPANKPMKDWSNENLRYYLYSNRVRRYEMQKTVTKEKDGNTTTATDKIFRAISALAKEELVVLAGAVCEILAMEQPIENKQIAFKLVSSDTSQSNKVTKTEIRPVFAPHDMLQGKEMYELFPEISAYFTVLMDTSVTGEVARNRAEVHAMLVMSRMLHVLSRVGDSTRPLEAFRDKSCLYGILRACSHLLKVPWMKSIHEGSDIGEGIVKELRKGVKQGLRAGWEKSLMDNFYTTQSMLFAQEQFDKQETEDLGVGQKNENKRKGANEVDCNERENNNAEVAKEENPLTLTTVPDQSRRFRRYSNLEVFLERVRNKMPLSLLVYSRNTDLETVFCFVSPKEEKPTDWILSFVIFDETRQPIQENGSLWYYRVKSLKPSTMEMIRLNGVNDMDIAGHTFKAFCVGLPMKRKSKWFTFITGDGEKFNDKKVFQGTL